MSILGWLLLVLAVLFLFGVIPLVSLVLKIVLVTLLFAVAIYLLTGGPVRRR